MNSAVEDPGFPRGGGANPMGAPKYDFAKFSQKNCIKLKEFGPRGEGHIPRAIT